MVTHDVSHSYNNNKKQKFTLEGRRNPWKLHHCEQQEIPKEDHGSYEYDWT
jgi:hypothetical protein